MPAPAGYLAEEMVANPVAELIVGVTRDPTGLMALTIGAGGILTELLRDSATLILPATAEAIGAALAGLRLFPILEGYRGRPAADLAAVTEAIRGRRRLRRGPRRPPCRARRQPADRHARPAPSPPTP